MVQFLLFAFAGLVVGMTSGLLGIGGGTLLVPLFVYGFKLPIQQAIGTSLCIIVPTALFSSLVHYHNGNIAFKLVLSLFVFAIIGGMVGAHLVNIVPAVALKKSFAVFLGIAAIKMFFS